MSRSPARRIKRISDPRQRLHPGGPTGAAASPAPRGPTLLLVIVSVLLAVAILAVYSPTFHYGYVSYDDDKYVYDNPMVQSGLSAAGVSWALRTLYYANWHPLTWISYMLDSQLFGNSAGAHHAINVLLHLGSTVILFLALAGMTRKPWRCALVAGVFALHPLHVESVAWISERKDVLSTLFAMLMLLAYVRYARSPSAWRYLPVALAFALSLMAKPMTVTWPFVLLLLDYWPMRRFAWPVEGPRLWRLALEKVPLLVMSAVGSVLTFIAQKDYRAVASLEQQPLPARFANAIVAYVSYIAKALWPRGLAVFYPQHRHPLDAVLGAALLLIAVTVAAAIWVRRRPYFAVGWFWYMGMLVPVIGFVQVGGQAMADRYTYVPLVGLSIALVWTAADALDKHLWPQRAAAAFAAVGLLMLAIVASRQTAYWADSRTLFEHTLAVTEGNHVIDNNLGVIMMHDGRSGEAVALFRQALAISPAYADAHTNLAHELIRAGQWDQAVPHLDEAIRLDPNQGMAHGDLGVLLAAQRKFEEAQPHLEQSVRLVPADATNQCNLCYVLENRGHPAEAEAHCREALLLKPDFSTARRNLATALAAQGKRIEAIKELTSVLQHDPADAEARAALNELQGGQRH